MDQRSLQIIITFIAVGIIAITFAWLAYRADKKEEEELRKKHR